VEMTVYPIDCASEEHVSTFQKADSRCIVATQMREHGFSGQQSHANVVRNLLISHGWNVTLLTPFSGRGFFRPVVFGLRYLLKQISGEIDVFWYRYGHSKYLGAALRQELKRDSQPAVIYAQDPLSAAAALALRRKGKDKVAMIVHFNDSQADEWVLRGLIKKDGWVYRQIDRLERQILPQVDELIYVSMYMKRRLENRIPALQGVSNSVIPNFVNEPLPDPSVSSADIIAIGTLEPRKNQAYILKVLAALRSRGIKVSATLVGDGGDRSKLEALADELQIRHQVTFAGDVREAARWISSHKIQVHAAHLENCPISLIEALAAGIPVVAAKVGGIPEVIDESTGEFWDLSSIEDGADKVQALLGDPMRLANAKMKCKERYRSTFSLNIAGKNLMNVFYRMAESTNSLGEKQY
jgi:glycosyltransferase involved in cell wall biosynthesis